MRYWIISGLIIAFFITLLPAQGQECASDEVVVQIIQNLQLLAGLQTQDNAEAIQRDMAALQTSLDTLARRCQGLAVITPTTPANDTQPVEIPTATPTPAPAVAALPALSTQQILTVYRDGGVLLRNQPDPTSDAQLSAAECSQIELLGFSDDNRWQQVSPIMTGWARADFFFGFSLPAQITVNARTPVYASPQFSSAADAIAISGEVSIALTDRRDDQTRLPWFMFQNPATGKTQWANAYDLAPSFKNLLVAPSQRVNVREQATTSANIVGFLPPGLSLKAVDVVTNEANESWFKFQAAAYQEGWVDASLFPDAVAGQPVLAPQETNIRTLPDTQAQIVTTASTGGDLIVMGADGGWLQVATPKVGWVQYAELLTFSTGINVVNQNGEIIIRKIPDQEAAILGALQPGESALIRTISDNGAWLRIEAPAASGWVFACLLDP